MALVGPTCAATLGIIAAAFWFGLAGTWSDRQAIRDGKLVTSTGRLGEIHRVPGVRFSSIWFSLDGHAFAWPYQTSTRCRPANGEPARVTFPPDANSPIPPVMPGNN